MGHLISRAIRRITQCSQQEAAAPREQKDSAESDQRQQHRRNDDHGVGSGRPTMESIPVGQSIDSAEYASFEQNKENKRGGTSKKIEERQQQQQQQSNTFNNINNDNNSVRINGAVTQPSDGDQNKPEVEEAVIKIQALVRGHLTRKALKDAQQHNATPHPNALGQSQFDEESLTRNPPSAVFLPSSPLNLNLSFTYPDQIKASNRLSSSKVPLESIAEDNEIQNSSANIGGQADQERPTPGSDNNDHDQAKLRLSPLDPSAPSNSGDSVSPVLSEANASIDLNCDTPASASIDISDHNIKPTDSIASVLHHKTSTSPQIDIREVAKDVETTTRVDTPPPSPIGQSPGDPEEAAAIRIQSAFRGYKTRKHSPYRRRSPPGKDVSLSNGSDGGGQPAEQTPPEASSTKRTMLRQQDATVIEQDDDYRPDEASKDDDEGIEEDGIGKVAQVADMQRRLSRQRQRDSTEEADKNAREDPAVQAAASIEEMTASEGSTVREVRPRRPSDDDEPSQPVDLRSALETASLSLADNVSANVESQASGFNATGLSAALDGVIGSSAAPGALITDNQQQQQQQRPSLGAKSEAGLSVELDTDSSNLGANLSLTEEENLSTHVHRSAVEDDIELAASANRLVEELTGEDEEEEEANKNSEAVLDEVTNILEEELEEATRDEGANADQEEQEQDSALLATTNEPEASSASGAALVSSATLDEVEQRTIELESDDIERRDPRGQVSEERAKSPQITAERPPLIETPAAAATAGGAPGDQPFEGANDQQEQQHLRVADEEIISGRSSPALLSSNGGSSSDDEAAGSDQADGAASGRNNTDTNQQQQQQRQAAGGAKNKKKNRNKKKGKK